MELTPYQRKQVELEAELRFVLHPTGSHYFGYEGDDYDWIVSTIDVPDAERRLIAAGFVERQPDGYDPDPTEWRNFRRGDVDIELAFKNTAQEIEGFQLTLARVFGAKNFGRFCKRDRRLLCYMVRAGAIR